MDNVTLTAHAAFRTLEASMTLLRRAIDIVKRVQSSRFAIRSAMKLSPVPAVVGVGQRGSSMADTATLPSIAAHGAIAPAVGRARQLQHRAQGRRRIHRRPRQQGRVPRIIENWRKSLRKAGDDPFGDEPSEEITKKELDDAAGQGRPRGRRHRAGRDRGILPGTGAGHPPLSQDQGLAGHRADRDRRRLSRQPRRRAGDRPHRRDPQGRRGRRSSSCRSATIPTRPA